MKGSGNSSESTRGFLRNRQVSATRMVPRVTVLKAKSNPRFTMTVFFDLYLPYFQRLTKNHIFLLQTSVPLSCQVGNIRSRIDPPNASCWPASDCGPEANPLRLMKDRQTGLMKKFPEQSGKIIRDRA
jgi:hypothetical protein